MTRYLYLNLTAGGALQSEWADWNRDHARDIVEHIPGMVKSQNFGLHPNYRNFHPETAASRPPYTLVNVFEADEQGRSSSSVHHCRRLPGLERALVSFPSRSAPI